MNIVEDHEEDFPYQVWMKVSEIGHQNLHNPFVWCNECIGQQNYEYSFNILPSDCHPDFVWGFKSKISAFVFWMRFKR
jgi:hypothetical protein